MHASWTTFKRKLTFVGGKVAEVPDFSKESGGCMFIAMPGSIGFVCTAATNNGPHTPGFVSPIDSETDCVCTSPCAD
jgi:hypothetical protein